MADNSTNELRLINTAAWIQGGGEGVNQGDFAPGTIAARVVNMDRQLTGADGATVNLVQHVLNLGGQLAAQGSLLQQIAAAVNNGVPIAIDYDRIARDIAANMPTFEVSPKAGK